MPQRPSREPHPMSITRQRLVRAVRNSRPVRNSREDVAGLHAAVAANPADDAPWLILADALDEAGKPHGADLMRKLTSRPATAANPTPYRTHRATDEPGPPVDSARVYVRGRLAGIPVAMTAHQNGWTYSLWTPGTRPEGDYMNGRWIASGNVDAGHGVGLLHELEPAENDKGRLERVRALYPRRPEHFSRLAPVRMATPPDDGWVRPIDGHSRGAILTLLGFPPPAPAPTKRANPLDDDPAPPDFRREALAALHHLTGGTGLVWDRDRVRFADYVRRHLPAQVPELSQWDRTSNPEALLPERVPLRTVGQLPEDETDPRNRNSPEWRQAWKERTGALPPGAEGMEKVAGREPGYMHRPRARGARESRPVRLSEAMLTEAQMLHRGVSANPHDRAAWAAMADWMMDHGKPHFGQALGLLANPASETGHWYPTMRSHPWINADRFAYRLNDHEAHEGTVGGRLAGVPLEMSRSESGNWNLDIGRAPGDGGSNAMGMIPLDSEHGARLFHEIDQFHGQVPYWHDVEALREGREEPYDPNWMHHGKPPEERMSRSTTPVRLSATDHAAFRAAIDHNPVDVAPWGIYADYLDEQGMHRHARAARRLADHFASGTAFPALMISADHHGEPDMLHRNWPWSHSIDMSTGTGELLGLLRDEYDNRSDLGAEHGPMWAVETGHQGRDRYQFDSHYVAPRASDLIDLLAPHQPERFMRAKLKQAIRLARTPVRLSSHRRQLVDHLRNSGYKVGSDPILDRLLAEHGMEGGGREEPPFAESVPADPLRPNPLLDDAFAHHSPTSPAPSVHAAPADPFGTYVPGSQDLRQHPAHDPGAAHAPPAPARPETPPTPQPQAEGKPSLESLMAELRQRAKSATAPAANPPHPPTASVPKSPSLAPLHQWSAQTHRQFGPEASRVTQMGSRAAATVRDMVMGGLRRGESPEVTADRVRTHLDMLGTGEGLPGLIPHLTSGVFAHHGVPEQAGLHGLVEHLRQPSAGPPKPAVARPPAASPPAVPKAIPVALPVAQHAPQPHHYEAIDPTGKDVSGHVMAHSREHAHDLLKARGLFPTAIHAPGEGGSPAPSWMGREWERFKYDLSPLTGGLRQAGNWGRRRLGLPEKLTRAGLIRAIRLGRGLPVRMGRSDNPALYAHALAGPFDRARWGVLADSLDESGLPGLAHVSRQVLTLPRVLRDGAGAVYLPASGGATDPWSHPADPFHIMPINGHAGGVRFSLARAKDALGEWGWLVGFHGPPVAGPGDTYASSRPVAVRVPHEAGIPLIHEAEGHWNHDPKSAAFDRIWASRLADARRQLGIPERLSRTTPVRLMRDLDHFLGGYVSGGPPDELADYLTSQGKPWTAEAFRRAEGVLRGNPHPLDHKHTGTAGSEAFTEGFHDDHPDHALRSAMLRVGVITRHAADLGRSHTHGRHHIIRLTPMVLDHADTKYSNRWNQPDIHFDTNDHALARGLIQEISRYTTGSPGEHMAHVASIARGERFSRRGALVRAIRLSRGRSPVRNIAPTDPFRQPGTWRRLGLTTDYDPTGTIQTHTVRSHMPTVDNFGRWSWGAGEVVHGGLTWEQVKASPALYRLYHRVGNLMNRPLESDELAHVTGEGPQPVERPAPQFPDRPHPEHFQRRGVPIRLAAHDDPAMLRGIAGDPWDNARHLIFADSLTEQGNPFGELIRDYATGRRNSQYWEWRDNGPHPERSFEPFHPDDNPDGLHRLGTHGPFDLYAVPTGMGGAPRVPLAVMAAPRRGYGIRRDFHYAFELSPHDVHRLADSLGEPHATLLHEAARRQWRGNNPYHPEHKGYDELAASPEPQREPEQFARRRPVRMNRLDFHRGIADNPGDLAHQLVYADWLEERGDPRHAIVRANARRMAPDYPWYDGANVVSLAPMWATPTGNGEPDHYAVRDLLPRETVGDHVRVEWGTEHPHDPHRYLWFRGDLPAHEAFALMQSVAPAHSPRLYNSLMGRRLSVTPPEAPPPARLSLRDRLRRAVRLSRGLSPIRLSVSDIPPLIAAAHESPNDKAPKLILADALHENGHSGLADVVRRATGHTPDPMAVVNPFYPPAFQRMDVRPHGLLVSLGGVASTHPADATRTTIGRSPQGRWRGLHVHLQGQISPGWYRTIANHSTHDPELIGRLLSENPPTWGTIRSYRRMLNWLHPIIGDRIRDLSPGLYGRRPDEPAPERRPSSADQLRTMLGLPPRRLSKRGQLVNAIRLSRGLSPVRLAHPMDHVAMQAAIAHAPEDDAPKLVYADMLDEEGHHDLADVFRRSTGDGPERWPAWSRAPFSRHPVTDAYGSHYKVPGAGAHVVVHERGDGQRHYSISPVTGIGTDEVSLHHGYETFDANHARAIVQSLRPIPDTGGIGSDYAHVQLRQALGMPHFAPERMSKRAALVRAIRMQRGPIRLAVPARPGDVESASLRVHRAGLPTLANLMLRTPGSVHPDDMRTTGVARVSGGPTLPLTLGVHRHLGDRYRVSVHSGDTHLGQWWTDAPTARTVWNEFAPHVRAIPHRGLMGTRAAFAEGDWVNLLQALGVEEPGYLRHLTLPPAGHRPQAIGQSFREDAVKTPHMGVKPVRPEDLRGGNSWDKLSRGRPVRMDRSDILPLWEAAKANPHDDAAWLILADALEEVGKPATAHLFRGVARTPADRRGGGGYGDPYRWHDQVPDSGTGSGRSDPRRGYVAGVPMEILHYPEYTFINHQSNPSRYHESAVHYVPSELGRAVEAEFDPHGPERMADRLRTAIRCFAQRDRGVSVGGATGRMDSANHDALVQALRATLSRSGLTPHRVIPAVHDVGGSARASAIAEVYGESRPHAADYGAAWQGLIAKMPGLVVFRSQPEGQDSVYRFGFRGPVQAMSQLLDNAGVTNRIFVPHGDATRVYLYDPGRKLREPVGSLLSRLNLTAVEHVGDGSPLGGGDDLGRSSYRDEIRRQEQPGQGGDQSPSPVRSARDRLARAIRLARPATPSVVHTGVGEFALRHPRLGTIGRASVTYRGPADYTLDAIDIDPAHQGRGHGTALLRGVADHLRRSGPFALSSSNESVATPKMLAAVFGPENVTHYYQGRAIPLEEAVRIGQAGGTTSSEARSGLPPPTTAHRPDMDDGSMEAFWRAREAGVDPERLSRGTPVRLSRFDIPHLWQAIRESPGHDRATWGVLADALDESGRPRAADILRTIHAHGQDWHVNGRPYLVANPAGRWPQSNAHYHRKQTDWQAGHVLRVPFFLSREEVLGEPFHRVHVWDRADGEERGTLFATPEQYEGLKAELEPYASQASQRLSRRAALVRAVRLRRGLPVRLMHTSPADHAAFHAAIAANRHDAAPRLVYADLLDETGHPEMADSLRRSASAAYGGRLPGSEVYDTPDYPSGWRPLEYAEASHRVHPGLRIATTIWRHGPTGVTTADVKPLVSNAGRQGIGAGDGYVTTDFGHLSRLLGELREDRSTMGKLGGARQVADGLAGGQGVRLSRETAVVGPNSPLPTSGRRTPSRPLPAWVPVPDADDPENTGFVNVASSWIAGGRYTRENGLEMVVKKGGKTFPYKGLTLADFRRFVASKSPGRWWWRTIGYPMKDAPTRERVKQAIRRRRRLTRAGEVGESGRHPVRFAMHDLAPLQAAVDHKPDDAAPHLIMADALEELAGQHPERGHEFQTAADDHRLAAQLLAHHHAGGRVHPLMPLPEYREPWNPGPHTRNLTPPWRVFESDAHRAAVADRNRHLPGVGRQLGQFLEHSAFRGTVERFPDGSALLGTDDEMIPTRTMSDMMWGVLFDPFDHFSHGPLSQSDHDLIRAALSPQEADELIREHDAHRTGTAVPPGLEE